MGRSNKAVQRLLASVGEPPEELKPSEVIGQLTKAIGNSQHEFTVPESHWPKVKAHFNWTEDKEDKDDKPDRRLIIVSMPPKFRNTILVKRGGYVVVDLYDIDELDPKNGRLLGDISNIPRNQKEWQRLPYWPVEFKQPEVKSPWDFEDSQDDDDDNDKEDEEKQG